MSNLSMAAKRRSSIFFNPGMALLKMFLGLVVSSVLFFFVVLPAIIFVLGLDVGRYFVDLFSVLEYFHCCFSGQTPF
jgi:hypothetical protein